MKRSVRSKIKFEIYSITIAIILLITIGFILWNIKFAKEISINYSKVYTENIINEINNQIEKEVSLILLASKEEEIINWLNEEFNEEYKEKGYDKILTYRNNLEDNNMFIAFEKSQNFYSIEYDTSVEKLKNDGTLDINVNEDQWFFESLKMKEHYDLNIDTDRFLNKMRVWINVPVISDGKKIGVIGTGLEIDPIISKLTSNFDKSGVSTIILDKYGSIQLDSEVKNIDENSYEYSKEIDKTIYKYDDSIDFKMSIQSYINEESNETIIGDTSAFGFDYFTIGRLGKTDWFVVSFFSINDIMPISNSLTLIIILLLGIISLGFFIENVLKKEFILPFEEINKSINSSEINNGLKKLSSRNDEFGNLASLVLNLVDSLDEYNLMLKNEVISNYQKINRLSNSMPIGVFILNNKYEFISFNNHMSLMFGYETINDFSSNVLTIFEMIEAKPLENKLLIELQNNGKCNTDIQIKKKNGKTIWCNLIIEKLEDNDAVHYEGLILDIQDKIEYQGILLDMATKDKLTNLFNRHHFDGIMLDEISRSERYGIDLTLIIFDLDFFKSVNDNHGHDIGDEVLKRVANEALKNIRDIDIIARWGGEEFIILMPHTGLNEGLHVAEKLRIIMEEVTHINDIRITSSFGVATRNFKETYIDWFKRADIALYRAKKFGRNRVETLPVSPIDQLFVHLEWRDSYNSSNDIIDEQHKSLFVLANSIMEKRFRNLEINDMELVLTLKKGVEEHFEDEENILKTIGYNEYIEHQLLHKGLIEKINSMVEDVKNEKVKTMDLISYIIEDVIVEHMFKDDMKYFKNLKEVLK